MHYCDAQPYMLAKENHLVEEESLGQDGGQVARVMVVLVDAPI